jgi:hypothetical protein
MNWRCPICHKPTNDSEHAHFPFCSDRCRLIDLGNWASERYRLAGPAAPSTSDEPATLDDKRRPGS